MRVVDLIRRKRDSGELTREEIEELIAAYTRGDIPDYHMSAWLMAAGPRGVSRRKVRLPSGRAPRHTGATLHKLESIPGSNVHLSRADFRRALETCGCAL